MYDDDRRPGVRWVWVAVLILALVFWAGVFAIFWKAFQ